MEAVIFDMDGVIFDSEQLVKKCWEAVGTKESITGIGDVFYQCLGTNKAATRIILHKNYGEAFDVDGFFAATRELFYKHTNEYGIPLKPYIKELLESLKGAGYKIGLASSTRYEAIVQETKQTDLYKYFDYIIGGDMVTNSKPDPEIFIKCAKGLGTSPDKAYVIEDSYNGIRAAYRAGMNAIMVPDMVDADDEMRSKAVVLKSLKAVEELILGEGFHR